MAWTKIKITPLGRRMHSARHRPKAVDRSKCQEQYSRRQDTENRPPNLDYNVIEEIADGVEKMILSWSHPKGGAFEERGSEDIIRPTPKKDASVAWTLPACNEVHHPSHAPSCKSHVLIAAMIDFVIIWQLEDITRNRIWRFCSPLDWLLFLMTDPRTFQRWWGNSWTSWRYHIKEISGWKLSWGLYGPRHH